MHVSSHSANSANTSRTFHQIASNHGPLPDAQVVHGASGAIKLVRHRDYVPSRRRRAHILEEPRLRCVRAQAVLHEPLLYRQPASDVSVFLRPCVSEVFVPGGLVPKLSSRTGKERVPLRLVRTVKAGNRPWAVSTVIMSIHVQFHTNDREGGERVEGIRTW